MPQPCKNHPEHLAQRRCYECKEHICSECASIAFHHFFCSTRCKAVHLAKIAAVQLKFLLHLSQKTRGTLRARSQSPLFKLITLERTAIFLILFFNIIVFLSFTARMTTLSQQLKHLQSNFEHLTDEVSEYSARVRYNEDILSTPKLDSLITGIVFESTITVSGSAGKNYLLALYVNGELRAAQPTQRGRFQFDDVHLLPGRNEIALKAVAPDNTVLHVGEMAVRYRSPGMEMLVSNVQRGSREFSFIALTFDGGSNAQNAREILDILREKNVISTIFLTGKFIEKYPDIVRRIVGDGHEVGNHTYSHRHLTTYEQYFRHENLPEMTFESFRRELTAADSLFREVTGINMKGYWRAPYGEVNSELREWAAALGYRHISWTKGQIPGESMDSHDWINDKTSELFKTAEEIRDALLNYGKNEPDRANGAIVLMHLGSSREEDNLYQTLPEIIDGFRKQGYTLCTVSDLLAKIDATENK